MYWNSLFTSGCMPRYINILVFSIIANMSALSYKQSNVWPKYDIYLFFGINVLLQFVFNKLNSIIFLTNRSYINVWLLFVWNIMSISLRYSYISTLTNWYYTLHVFFNTLLYCFRWNGKHAAGFLNVYVL